MSGRKTEKGAASDRVTKKAMSPAHFRRQKMLRKISKPDSPILDWAIALLACPLGDDDDVSRFYGDVFAARILKGGVVVEAQTLLRLSLIAKDHDLAARGEVVEALSHRDRIEHRGVAFDLVTPGQMHVAEDGDFQAVDLADDYRNI